MGSAPHVEVARRLSAGAGWELRRMVGVRTATDDRCVTRLMIMWRRPYHLTGEQAREWARQAAERLAASDGVGRAVLMPLHSAADGHIRDSDWLLELHLSPGMDPRELVDEGACAEWLADLRQLGTEPRVMLADDGIGLRPLDR